MIKHLIVSTIGIIRFQSHQVRLIKYSTGWVNQAPPQPSPNSANLERGAGVEFADLPAGIFVRAKHPETAERLNQHIPCRMLRPYCAVCSGANVAPTALYANPPGGTKTLSILRLSKWGGQGRGISSSEKRGS